MAQRITLTGDVTAIATASNTDGSIRLHLYTRVVAGKPAVYVQREVGGALTAEVLLMQEGTIKSAAYNVTRAQFDFVYELNESLYLVRIDEATVPTTQTAQTDTFQAEVSLFPGGAAPPDNRTVAALSAVRLWKTHSPQVYAGSDPEGVTVTASQTAGTFKVRWNPDSSTAAKHIAGFNVYVFGPWRRLIKLNGALIPFVATIPTRQFELEVPALAGRYLVTQVDCDGDETGLVQAGVTFGPAAPGSTEGRLKASAEVLGNGRSLAFAASDIELSPGGQDHRAPEFSGTSFVPVLLGTLDDLLELSPGGADLSVPTFETVDFAPASIVANTDNLGLSPGGEGFLQAFTLTGFGTIIVT